MMREFPNNNNPISIRENPFRFMSVFCFVLVIRKTKIGVNDGQTVCLFVSNRRSRCTDLSFPYILALLQKDHCERMIKNSAKVLQSVLSSWDILLIHLRILRTNIRRNVYLPMRRIIFFISFSTTTMRQKLNRG